MKHKQLSGLTDQELLNEVKKRKSSSYINALLIGFLIGIIIYSIVENSIVFFTLIPLFFVFKVFNNSTNHDNLDKELKSRNLN
jgi:hypothetical protein